jgi:hypothetical protein
MKMKTKKRCAHEGKKDESGVEKKEKNKKKF